MVNPTTIAVKDATGASQTVSTLDTLINGTTLTDRSGTVTSGGVAQTLMALNTGRRGFLVQNNSTGDLWISSVGTAAATQPSIWLPPGSYYEPAQGGVATAAVSIFGATTGQAFTAREW